MEPRVEEIAENRVRLTVDVPGRDVKHAVEHAASDLAGNLKFPGFRKGKVPMPVLLARVGREALIADAVESHIGGWFWNAAARTRIRPIAEPEFDFELPESDRADWRFSATVEVQPKPTLADWTQLEVPRGETEVPGELIDEELERLRTLVAETVDVDGRPAAAGDVAVVDLLAGDDTQRDYVVELGTGRLVEELERELIGMAPGERRSVELATGEETTMAVELVLKELREKVLPPVDDELARAASEYETLDELRNDIEGTLHEQLEEETEARFRAAAADALVAASRVEAAGPLVDARTRELANGFVRSVEGRGIPFDTYLQLTGTSPEDFVARLREEASRSVARELTLEAAADQLGIEVGDEDVERVIREQAEAVGDDPDVAIAAVREADGYERLREDLRLRDALTRIASEVTPIPVELADAREKLWTPGKETAPADTKLWTPGSKEPA